MLCTTGIGVSIAANKVRGIRCALLADVECAKLTRLHNDTNMMAMGAAVVDRELAFEIVKTWLNTPFSGEARHQRRINKVMDCECEEKKKKTRKRRRRRPRSLSNFFGGVAGSLIGSALNIFLCVLLVLSMLLTPIATYVTNMTDPETLVNMLFESGLFDNGDPEEAPTEGPTNPDDPTSPDDPTNPDDSISTEDAQPENNEQENAEDEQDPAATEDENIPAVIDDPEAGETENTEPENTEPENTEPENIEPENTEPENTEPESTDPETPDQPESTNDVLNTLLGLMGGLTGTDIIDTDHLNEFLDIPEDATVDVGKLGEGLTASGAAQALVSAYMTDVMNTAMGVEGEPSLTPDSVMAIVSPHIGELADIVQASLPEGVELDREHLVEITESALESALPALIAELPDLGTAANEFLESDPTIAAVAKVLRFIRSGALRAAVLLIVVALCMVICLIRLPGLRGLRTVGICGVVSGVLCYGTTVVLHRIPELTALLPAELASFGDLFLKIIVPFTTGLEKAFVVCAVVYAVIGLALVLGTTVLRGFFAMTIGRFFSDED